MARCHWGRGADVAGAGAAAVSPDGAAGVALCVRLSPQGNTKNSQVEPPCMGPVCLIRAPAAGPPSPIPLWREFFQADRARQIGQVPALPGETAEQRGIKIKTAVFSRHLAWKEAGQTTDWSKQMNPLA